MTGPAAEVYRGPEYRALLAARAAPDPLLHPDPHAPGGLYRAVVRILRLLIPRLFRLQVDGLHNLPAPPYIIAANHQRWFDSAFLMAVFPARPMLYSMARRDTVFNRRWKRRLVPRLGVFPISPSRGELDAQGVSSVYHVLSRGGVVIIFPEGRYSRGQELRPLKKGVAHFALEAGVPICPVAISGLDRLRLLSRVRISIGRPIRPDPPAWWAASRRVFEMVERVRRSILHAFGGSRRGARRRPGRAGPVSRLRGWLRMLLRGPDRGGGGP